MDICKHDEFCGGCSYQNLQYQEQLRIKEEQVLEFAKASGIKPKKFEHIEPSPMQYRYRNKMEYTFGDLVKDGEMTLGMHKKGHFMSIVTVEECQLVHKDFNKILEATLNFCKKYTKYHKRRHEGLMRNLVLRRGERTGEILVNIVTTGEPGFDEQGFCRVINSLSLDNKIVGILRSINDDFSDAIKCQELRILQGRDFYMEKIMDLDFKVSAFSFFQTNVTAAERLYQDAIALIDDFSGKTVFDLFCGTGTITQSLARSARRVVGVEIVEEAVESARENAKLNNLENCEFIAGDVFKVLDSLDEKPDVIVVDPPRPGIQGKALGKIASYGVEEILYISCNPKTLCMDLARFKEYGYEVEYMKPYDNFANTRHVETIVFLSHKKPDSQINVKVEFGDENGKFPIDNIAEKAEGYKPKEKVTYKMIQSYIKEKYNLKMHTAYIAEVKRNSGMKMQMEVKSEGTSQDRKSHPSKEKVEIIKDALSHFNLI